MRWLRKQCTPRWWAHNNGYHNWRGSKDLYGKHMEPDEEDGCVYRKTSCSSFYYYMGSGYRCCMAGIFGGKYITERWKYFKSGLYWMRKAFKNE